MAVLKIEKDTDTETVNYHQNSNYDLTKIISFHDHACPLSKMTLAPIQNP